ncbi:hypothetical protein SAMN05216275_113144 [Streptosporangium canum]|uniref:Uncharacterized protein n=1 Tax=Streptosporangium canum TaxID=324952 RepID=A0A1I3V170_9ACTN|nr:V-type ATPase subunit [Streptosporangium canum]SFJ87937.1 hypothetical protein SAMN05216275_113144 [Streptosporangium canum]
MTAAWVAGSTRARALAHRRAGLAAAGRIAACDSLEQAVTLLAGTPYGHDMRRGQSLPEAQWAILATLLWHLRVLAGWLPREGGQMVRVLARWFELANVDELMHRLSGRQDEPEFALGSMGTVWPRLRRCVSLAEIRATLTTSPWGDPGGDSRREIQLGMRLAWAARVADAVPSARSWVLGAAALLVARARYAEGHALSAGARDRCRILLGAGTLDASSVTEMTQRLPSAARWALRGVEGSRELWAGEERWWRRVEGEGHGLLTGSGFSMGPVVGAVAVLAADARRVRAALEPAARGSGGDGPT